MSSEDIGALQTNFFINNLLEVMALEETAEKKNGKRLKCENCDFSDEVMTRCKVCCVFLCEFCTQSHRRTKATNQHQLLTIEEVKAAGPSALTKPLLCSKHKQETLKLFCSTCDIPICRDCIIIDHKNHRYAFMEDICVQQKEEITRWIKGAKSGMFELTTAIDDIEKNEKLLEGEVATIEKEIDNFMDNLNEAVERKRKSLKEDLRRISEEKTKRLQSQKEELSVPLGTLQSCVTFAEDVLRKCDDTEILSLKKQIAESFVEVKRKTWHTGNLRRLTESISLMLNDNFGQGIARAAAIKGIQLSTGPT